ncbi:MAG: hypothetical protein ACI9Z9_002677, partial [Litorivivens sp.]
EMIASLDDLKKKKVNPHLTAVDGTTTTDENASTAGDDSSIDNEVVDDEMVGIVDNVTTEISDALPLPKAAADVADSEEAKPDAYLIETGHILLDLIASEKRTADK